MAAELATKDAAENSRRDIVRWWDAGRLRFNLYFGAVVVVTLLLVMIADSTAGETGRGLSRATRGDLRPVRIRLLGEHLLQLGWISDAFAFQGGPRVGLYDARGYSVVLTALPRRCAPWSHG